MESREILISKFIQEKFQFSAEISNYTWPSEMNFNFFDFGVSGQFKGRLLTGRGTSATKEVALTVAVSEFLERCALVQNNIPNSNGVAGHFKLDTAMTKSIEELVERQVYFLSWLTPFALQEVPEKTLTKLSPELLPEFKEFSKSIKWTIRHFYIASLWGKHVFATMCYGGAGNQDKFGSCFGLGCSDKPDTALGSSITECFRHVSSCIYGQVKTTSIEAFDLLSYPGPDDQQQLLMNPTWFFESILPNLLIVPWDGNWFDLSRFHERDITSTHLNSSFYGKDFGLKFIHSASPSFLPLYFGRPNEAIVKNEILMSLQRVMGTTGFKQKLPHFLG